MANVGAGVGYVDGEDRVAAHRRVVVQALLIIVAVIVSNLNALSAGFVWDDGTLIANNPLIKQWNTLPALLTETFLTIYYRPMVMLSFALEYALWGLRPFGFHLTNLLLHAANSILVFLILRRISGNADTAFLGALLFTVHPAHKGVVAIMDRTGILSAFFFFGSLLLYMGYRDSGSRRKAWIRYAASVALCTLAFFSKEEAMMLPVVIIMTDVFLFPERVKRSRTLSAVLYAPFFASAALYVSVRASVVGPMSAMAKVIAVEPIRRLLTVPEIMLDYLILAMFPLKLDFNPRTPLTAGPELSTWGAAVIMLLIAATIPWLFKRFKPVAFGVLWFPIVFIPMSNIIPIFADVADRELFTPIHFLYLPSIGIFLCAGFGLRGMFDHFKTRGVGRFHRSGAALCVVWIVLAFCVLSLKRNTIWKDEIRLFGYMVQMHPERPSAHLNLGNAYLNVGRLEEAFRECQRAVALQPDAAENHNNLGLAYLRMGLPDKAIEEFREAVRLKPDHAGSYGNMAVAYVEKGKLEEAIAANEKAVALTPSSSQMRTNLGLIYMRAGRLGEAEEQFLTALDNDPTDAEAYNALGSLHFLQREYGRARYHWERALRIRPGLKEARENLENLNRTKR